MHLQVDIDTADPPSGRVRVAGDPEHAVPFEGWLGLMAALRILREGGEDIDESLSLRE